MAGNIRSENIYGSHQQPDTVINAYEIDARTVATRRGFNRVSLRAVIAGTIIALITMVALSTLGLAIGATTLNAMIDTNRDPLFDLGTGTIIWMAITNLIALFVGGWVAGYLAGVPDKTDGILHGLVTFGVVTLLSLWLFTSTTGRIISGAAGAINEGLTLLGAGAAAISPAAADAIDRQDFTRESIQAEARTLLRDTGDPALQPGEVEQEQEAVGDITSDTATAIVENPGNIGDELSNAVDRFLNLGAVQEADRGDLVNILVARTDMTEEEARQAVDRWESTYRDVTGDAEAAIKNAADDLTEAIAAAAGVVFMGLVVGAFAAGTGGYLGTPEPKETLVTEAE